MAALLSCFFNPKSIAVVGASNRTNSVGKKVFKNLVQGKFVGKLYAVNPKHDRVQKHPCYPSVKTIQDDIDLVIITTPNHTIEKILRECGEKNIHAAVIISSGFSETGKEGHELENKIIHIAQQYQIRLIGPNCLGIMCPYLQMNATFDNNFALPGDIALISQSGAISAAIIDWSINKKIGFSNLISLGNSSDIGFAECLEHLANDVKTKSILLYIEGIKHAKQFMQALRKAASVKPVIAIKAGINQQGTRAALSHTGSIIGDDDVFDAALKQAGVVRVNTIYELFSAAEVLSNQHKKLKENPLVIITNGGGAGVMAADEACKLNVNLPVLSEKTIEALNQVLPKQWSHQNPVDIIGDATPKRYHDVLQLCANEDIDGIIIVLVPVAMSDPLKVAKQIIQDSKQIDKLIITCWMGEKQVKTSWKLFEKNNMPFFTTPEKAVAAFYYLTNYYANHALLKHNAKLIATERKIDVKLSQTIIKTSLSENKFVLTTIEAKQLLKACHVPITETFLAKTKEEAVRIAHEIGFPIVMKIHSPDIVHKQEANGVLLNIRHEEEVKTTFDKLIASAKMAFPHANILGVTLEEMIKTPYDRELMIGILNDKVFGPVVCFGSGGVFVEIQKDRALALPPLNNYIAKELISRTKISNALKNFRNFPDVDLNKIVDILLNVSEMIALLPNIQEMDINPLIVNEKTAIAVDARIVIK